MIDRLDRQLIALTCGDVGHSLNPFQELAASLDVSEDEVIQRLRKYRSNGSLRRFGAVLRHTRAGYRANGMSVWNVPDSDVARIGKALAQRPEISHCYERRRFDDWQYNVYGMIHGHTADEVLAVARSIANSLSLSDYDVLFSLREFKKTSMTYQV